MEITYTLSQRFTGKSRALVMLRGSAVEVRAVKLALNQRGWVENADGDFERECSAGEINQALWFLVKNFGVTLRWVNTTAKKKPKAQPDFKTVKLVPVPVEKVRPGMVISGKGRVNIADPNFTGRGIAKKGKTLRHFTKRAPQGYKIVRQGISGFLFGTDDHPDGCFYAAGSTVWCVK